MKKNHTLRHSHLIAAIVGAFMAGGLPPAAAEDIFFVRNGVLVAFSVNEGALEAAGALTTSESIVRHKGPVHEFLGAMPGGRALVSLGTPNLLDSMIADKGVDIAILAADGAVERVVMPNAVRAWPSPDGARIAVIDLDYSLHLFENGALRPVDMKERVVLAAWSPDGARLCLTAYPPDWSPRRAHNPESTEDFLRLHNSDLYLLEAAAPPAKKLTSAPGYDYSAVWLPDGEHVMFISSRDGIGAFFKLNVATGALEKLTNKAPGSYDIPVGRSDSFVWSPKTGEWLYSAQEADDARRDSIRAVTADGAASRLIGFGRHVRLADDGSAAVFLDTEGQPRTAALQPVAKEDAR